MSSQHNLSPDMQERYGVKRNQRSRWIFALVASLAFTGLVYVWKHSQSVVTGELQKFDVVSKEEVSISFRLTRTKIAPAFCVLRAQDVRKTDVGYATLSFPSSGSSFNVTYPLKTESTAVLAEILGCSDKLPLRVPPPNFPPGVRIPAQVPPGVAPVAQ